ncbi:MAG: DsrE family protein [Methanomassiliicoccales archaeon]|nr:MAG: DsrE family protein [Methanomassiliicoccales archaeon]
MAKGLTILLKTGPMMSMEPNTAIKLAKAALNRGYNVNIFCYGEGVLSIKKNQAPKRFPNVGQELVELAEKGVKIAVCETCSIARGLHHGEEIAGTKIGSLTKDFVEFLDGTDRLITLGR